MASCIICQRAFSMSSYIVPFPMSSKLPYKCICNAKQLDGKCQFTDSYIQNKQKQASKHKDCTTLRA